MKKNEKTINNYAVYYLSDKNKSIKEISEELGLTSKMVSDIISSRGVEKNSEINTTSSKVTSKDLMIRETSNKKTKSVAIMTKSASEVNDSFRQKINNATSRTSRDAIHRPNNK